MCSLTKNFLRRRILEEEIKDTSLLKESAHLHPVTQWSHQSSKPQVKSGKWPVMNESRQKYEELSGHRRPKFRAFKSKVVNTPKRTNECRIEEQAKFAKKMAG